MTEDGATKDINERYQSYIEFPAHSKNFGAVSSLLLLMDSNVFERMNFPMIVVFEAFSVESYVNHLGFLTVDHWEEVERLPWRSKISILHKIAGVEANWGEDPLQFASQIFKVRDKMAHGKPEVAYGSIHATHDEAESELSLENIQPDWYKEIDRKWIKASKGRLQKLMKYLAKISGQPPMEYMVGGHGGVNKIR
jgi:hypothetical protein